MDNERGSTQMDFFFVVIYSAYRCLETKISGEISSPASTCVLDVSHHYKRTPKKKRMRWQNATKHYKQKTTCEESLTNDNIQPRRKHTGPVWCRHTGGDVGREKKAKLREAKQTAGLHQRFRVTGKYRRSQWDKRHSSISEQQSKQMSALLFHWIVLKRFENSNIKRVITRSKN